MMSGTTGEDETSVRWTAALKQLRGDFRRGRVDSISLHVLALVYLMVGGYLVVKAVTDPWLGMPRQLGWLPIVLGAGGIGFALWTVIWQAGTKYRFSDGIVGAVSANGRIRWQEPLATLQRVSVLRPMRGSTWLVLHWETTRHRVELYDSIDDAVDELVRSADSRPNLPEASETEPPPWQCTHCGEANPDTFEMCWKCEAPRGSGTVQ